MRHALPLVLAALVFGSCSGDQQDATPTPRGRPGADARFGPDPRASSAGQTTAGQWPRPHRGSRPDSFGLPLEIEIDAPEVPAEIAGPTPETAEE